MYRGLQRDKKMCIIECTGNRETCQKMSARADYEKRKQNGNHSEDGFFDSELAAKTFKRKDAGHPDANDYGAGQRRLSVCAADNWSVVYQAMEKRGMAVGISLLLCLLAGNLFLKPLVGRIRPYDLVEGFQLLIKPLAD